MANAGDKGARVAEAIGAIKWVLIALVILCTGVVALAVAAYGSSGSETIAGAAIAVGAVMCVFIWVLFGWFEHTLLALVAIARNTTPPVSVPPVVPPATQHQV